tara:strand:+ start:363 stop:500 length:138 start_codon:yes stop_codon:yes gene_type:complete
MNKKKTDNIKKQKIKDPVFLKNFDPKYEVFKTSILQKIYLNSRLI